MFFYRWRLNRIAIFIILREQTEGGGGGVGAPSTLLSLSLVPQESDESSPREEGGRGGGGSIPHFLSKGVFMSLHVCVCGCECPFSTPDLSQAARG